MENKIKKSSNLFEKIKKIIDNNKKTSISFLIFVFVLSSFFIYFNFYQNSQHKKIAESYIKANIYLSQNKKNKSKEFFKGIILSKNKFYSLLALNKVIDNNLEDDIKILDYFDILEKINLENEQKNLIKLKKALFLIKISKNQEGKKLLEELSSDNSIWRETSLEILK